MLRQKVIEKDAEVTSVLTSSQVNGSLEGLINQQSADISIISKFKRMYLSLCMQIKSLKVQIEDLISTAEKQASTHHQRVCMLVSLILDKLLKLSDIWTKSKFAMALLQFVHRSRHSLRA